MVLPETLKTCYNCSFVGLEWNDFHLSNLPNVYVHPKHFCESAACSAFPARACHALILLMLEHVREPVKCLNVTPVP